MRVEWTFNLDRAVKMSGKYDQRQRHSETMALTSLLACVPLAHDAQKIIVAHRTVRINCSSESFTRYLIERCSAGYLNCFRELDARIVACAPPDVPLLRAFDGQP